MSAMRELRAFVTEEFREGWSKNELKKELFAKFYST